jgi:hypothetical protein
VLVSEYPRDARPRWGWHNAPAAEAVAQVIEAGSPAYEEPIEDMVAMLDWAGEIPRVPHPGEPGWENDWWGTIDALMQCASLRRRDPPLYVEIGSGFSTLFAARAISDFGLRTKIVSVDAAPREEIDAVCDEIMRCRLEEVCGTILGRLGPGDIVLLDGSHVALMNSDATVFFLELLPHLPAGVLVGIHDVFLPWDYPPTWEGRPYGEQYLLAAFLLGGAAGYTIRFPAWWVVENSPLAARLTELWPVVENRFGRHATSFWLERTAG